MMRLLAALLLVLAACSPRAGAAPGSEDPAVKPKGTLADAATRWQEIDRLAEEQQLEAAAAKAAELRAAAVASNDEDNVVRGLVRETQLRIALGGFETAVEALRGQAKLSEPLARAMVSLLEAHALTAYYGAYSWEIQQRERVASGPSGSTERPADLKAWTADDIRSAAREAFEKVWAERAALGRQPRDRFGDLVDENTYPREVRGTMRDVLSYLFVEFLADTSLWSPRESNQIYRLDLAKLLNGGPEPGARETHPLGQLAAVLHDLERWHQGEKSKAAALEARLELVRRLQASFDRAADRKALIADLSRRLDAYRSDSWWAMGQATLAGLVRNETAPDALVRARAIALEGVKAYPDSPGARFCRQIVAEIEAPQVQLEAMQTDATGQRSVRVTAANTPRLFFRAFQVDVAARLGRGERPWPELQRLVARSRPEAAWAVDLPATPDYRPHRTYVTPPMTATGAWVVASSRREDFGERDNEVLGVQMVLGDVVLVNRAGENSAGGQGLLVLSGAAGGPIADASVHLYRHDWRNNRLVALEPRRTDRNGWAPLSVAESGSHIVLARRGEEIGLLEDLGLGDPRPERDAHKSALVFTDRAIYRPGQTVHFKVLVYRRAPEAERLRPVARDSVTVTLTDPNGQTAAERTLSTNEFGTASADFTVPPGRVLGAWSIRTTSGGQASIRVEEYKRPTFEVEIQDPAEPARLNRPAHFRGEARYYFGLPVASGRVAWRVERVPVMPLWYGWWWPQPQAQPEVVAAGEAALAADGGFQVDFTPAADETLSEDQAGLTYRFRLSAEVTDEGGETREASRSFRLGFVTLEATLEPGSGFLLAAQPSTLDVRRTGLDGEPRPGAGSVTVLRLRQPERTVLPAEEPAAAEPVFEDGPAPGRPTGGAQFQTAGDALAPRWNSYQPERTMARWADGEAVFTAATTHAAPDAIAHVALPGLEAGAYRIRYETVDPFGAKVQAQREILVAASVGVKAVPLRLPAVLEVDETSVRVGETARIFSHSGIDRPVFLLETYRGSVLAERRWVRPEDGSELLELPIRAADRGGFGLRLAVLRDHQWMEIQRDVFVPWDDRELDVAFSTFRDRLRPAERETWTVTVRDKQGRPVERGAAEVLAWMYDRSLDVFAKLDPPDPMQLYPQRTGVPWSRLNLSGRGAAWLAGQPRDGVDVPDFQPDRFAAFDTWGIGGPGMRGRVVMMANDMAVGASPQARAMPAPASEVSVAQEAVLGGQSRAAEKDGRDIGGEEPPALRSDFAETAFWQPHLLTGADGAVSFEFTVPDSVTSWNVWVNAVTRDLAAGSTRREARSVKELMARPYLPRFLREGDRAELRVVMNNASDGVLSGDVTLEVAATGGQGEDRLAAFGLDAGRARARFSAPPGGSDTVVFPLTAPREVGTVAFKVVARAGAISDGELRPLPILPSRLYLAQSRFAALKGAGATARRELHFADLAASAADPSLESERLVVTLDAQLFYSILAALPYLVDYPYECTEQTLNRFLSTGIVSSLFDRFPAVARVAQDLAKRETRYETWDSADPNRKMALEETPWLETARGGDPGAGEARDLVRVLDPRVARAERDAALRKLEEAQYPSGAFPWWDGGPPSPYMTLYLMYGFAKAAEFDVDVPRQVVQRGWNYLADEIRREMLPLLRKKDGDVSCGCVEFLTFLNYVASAYPDPSWMGEALSAAERKEILDLTFRNWKRHSPYLKGLLALTLKRAGRAADAALVWQSVMDSAKTTVDEGTFWNPEDRAWFWYNDTIETHAFALRVLSELAPADPRREGMVQWLFLNKKLGHWKSTRATAEVLYSLADYLKREKQLATREEATVWVAGRTVDFVFEPDRYTGKKNQIVVPGEQLGPRDATVVVEKKTPGILFASATWHFATDQLPKEARGDLFNVERAYFIRRRAGAAGGSAAETVLEPLTDGVKLAVGDEVEVQLSISSRAQAEYIHVRDPRPAGLEPGIVVSGIRWDQGLARYEETRDSGTNFFFEWFPAGQYTLRYRLRANVAGTFRTGPATMQSMYAPEFTAYSSGRVLEIRGGG